MYEIKFVDSPHFRKNRLAPIDTIVVHYISAVNVLPKDPFNLQKCLDFLTKPLADANGVPYKDKRGNPIRVSAHTLIDRDGTRYQLVNEDYVAWHSGRSSLYGRSIRNSVNDFSLGVELIGGKWIEFTEQQYKSLIEYTYGIIIRKAVKKSHIVGHEHVSPGRKQDPGKLFDWEKYYKGLYGYKTLAKKEKSVVKFSNKILSLEKKMASENIIQMENNITDGNAKSFIEKIMDFIIIFFKKIGLKK